MINKFSESVVGDASLSWPASLGWTVRHGSDVAPGALCAERFVEEAM